MELVKNNTVLTKKLLPFKFRAYPPLPPPPPASFTSDTPPSRRPTPSDWGATAEVAKAINRKKWDRLGIFSTETLKCREGRAAGSARGGPKQSPVRDRRTQPTHTWPGRSTSKPRAGYTLEAGEAWGPINGPASAPLAIGPS